MASSLSSTSSSSLSSSLDELALRDINKSFPVTYELDAVVQQIL